MQTALPLSCFHAKRKLLCSRTWPNHVAKRKTKIQSKLSSVNHTVWDLIDLSSRAPRSREHPYAGGRLAWHGRQRAPSSKWVRGIGLCAHLVIWHSPDDPNSTQGATSPLSRALLRQSRLPQRTSVTALSCCNVARSYRHRALPLNQ